MPKMNDFLLLIKYKKTLKSLFIYISTSENQLQSHYFKIIIYQ